MSAAILPDVVLPTYLALDGYPVPKPSTHSVYLDVAGVDSTPFRDAATSVFRAELRRFLTDWQSGQCQSREIRDWAEEQEDRNRASDAVVREIIGHLAIADTTLTTPDEIPLFLRMLDLPEAEALEAHERYGSRQDMAAVKEKWKDDPFYQPFCD